YPRIVARLVADELVAVPRLDGHHHARRPEHADRDLARFGLAELCDRTGLEPVDPLRRTDEQLVGAVAVQIAGMEPVVETKVGDQDLLRPRLAGSGWRLEGVDGTAFGPRTVGAPPHHEWRKISRCRQRSVRSAQRRGDQLLVAVSVHVSPGD